MRVLQINTVCGTGSTGRIASDIANMLKMRGHECLVCYGRGEGRNCDNTYKIGGKMSSYIHAIKTRIFDKHGLGSKGDTKRLVRKIVDYNPDIVHLHNIHGYYLNYDILFEFLHNYNKPVIWTLHDCWSFTGHCANFDFVGCDKWTSLCRKCPQKTVYPSSYVFDNSKKNYDIKKAAFNRIDRLTIVSPSQWLSKLVKQSFLQKHEVRIVHNGIDIQTFRPTESTFREENNIQNKKVILGVANVWDKRKGFEDFVELSKKIDEQTAIVLVGLTKRQLKLIGNNIIGITRTNSTQELAKLYSAADVFFNPTYEDNYPTTNLEALACGTPVITYNTGGSIESVDSEKGFVIEKGKYEDVIGIVNNKLGSIDGEAISAYARDNFDKNKCFSKYLQIYEEELSKR